MILYILVTTSCTQRGHWLRHCARRGTCSQIQSVTEDSRLDFLRVNITICGPLCSPVKKSLGIQWLSTFSMQTCWDCIETRSKAALTFWRYLCSQAVLLQPEVLRYLFPDVLWARNTDNSAINGAILTCVFAKPHNFRTGTHLAKGMSVWELALHGNIFSKIRSLTFLIPLTLIPAPQSALKASSSQDKDESLRDEDFR